jgi:hypothetical protein
VIVDCKATVEDLSLVAELAKLLEEAPALLDFVMRPEFLHHR